MSPSVLVVLNLFTGLESAQRPCIPDAMSQAAGRGWDQTLAAVLLCPDEQEDSERTKRTNICDRLQGALGDFCNDRAIASSSDPALRQISLTACTNQIADPSNSGCKEWANDGTQFIGRFIRPEARPLEQRAARQQQCDIQLIQLETSCARDNDPVCKTIQKLRRKCEGWAENGCGPRNPCLLGLPVVGANGGRFLQAHEPKPKTPEEVQARSTRRAERDAWLLNCSVALERQGDMIAKVHCKEQYEKGAAELAGRQSECDRVTKGYGNLCDCKAAPDHPCAPATLCTFQDRIAQDCNQWVRLGGVSPAGVTRAQSEFAASSR